ncbi:MULTISPECIES: hypothetical protein [Rhizobium]|uniref:Uncharacterized protein n=1 Tax=Rhizobium tropici TaxID=398 RepID=A0A6P1C9F6_RHITR|nr:MULTISPECIES: hypothetical protein [Rhizobium]AGB71019.1 hypothetical protein RTCIAT899_CH08135 [Rhizobium tropici CIAT 899]MBB4242391.1 hypothetical protein [Rhizobium tropici]MBB5594034.1 hypothetical protein [Rhizobium tropici]MBB6492845.1 hypothetical protein [Rhizobium tropici]NEV13367.1 hypothetical protein [Rhizobium tropici]
MIRARVQNIGGPFPGVGAAPEMTRDKVLPADGRAAFEKLNDAVSTSGVLINFGSFVPANDNDKQKADAA